MSGFLDTLPLDFSLQETQELWRFLASTYYKDAQVEQIVLAAGIDPSSIAWGKSGRDLWADVLTQARNQDRLQAMLTNLAHGKDAAVGQRIAAFLVEHPPTEPPEADRDVDFAPEGDPGELERQLEAEPTLLDVSFLERGLQLAPAVVRLLVTRGTERVYGTGFRIGPDLLLTNHHVLFGSDGNPATAVEIWCGFERSFDGAEREHTVLAGDPASIVGAVDHDWAVVRTTSALPDNAPVIDVTGDAGTVALDDRVYIIQHPNGGVKKIGMIHNVVRYVDADVVGYRTDTEGGSSGSPVFDEQWRLVALHHRWVERTIDGRPEVLNQGQRIEKVRAGLTAAGVM